MGACGFFYMTGTVGDPAHPASDHEREECISTVGHPPRCQAQLLRRPLRSFTALNEIQRVSKSTQCEIPAGIKMLDPKIAFCSSKTRISFYIFIFSRNVIFRCDGIAVGCYCQMNLPPYYHSQVAADLLIYSFIQTLHLLFF